MSFRPVRDRIHATTRKGAGLGQPVVHFEIVGQGAELHRYYAEPFGWDIDSNNPMDYGIVQREANVNAGGVGIGGVVKSV
jgi:hypothetical protein